MDKTNMRRNEKAIPQRTNLDTVIHQAEICHLACCAEDEPYVIPISFGYDGKSIFFHTAKTGKKINILAANPRVCLAFEDKITLVKDKEQSCKWSFDFSSVIVTGEIEEISDSDGKKAALNQIMLHYSKQSWQIPAKDLSKTKVWRVKIENITGKQSPAKPA